MTPNRQYLTPDYYLEGELVHYLDVLWPQYGCDQTFPRMDRLIDEMSEQVIEDCVHRKFIKDIKADDIRHLKKFARKLQHFYQGRQYFIALCASTGTPRDPVGGLAARYQQFV